MILHFTSYFNNTEATHFGRHILPSIPGREEDIFFFVSDSFESYSLIISKDAKRRRWVLQITCIWEIPLDRVFFYFTEYFKVGRAPISVEGGGGSYK